MQSSRRNWIKTIGFGIADIGLSSVQAVASPNVITFSKPLNISDILINLYSNEKMQQFIKALQG